MSIKTEIAAKLKEAGLRTITWMACEPGKRMFARAKAYNGSQKGFVGGNIGPMTATMAHLERNEEVEQEVQKVMLSIPGVEMVSYDKRNSATFKISLNEKMTREITFAWELIPTNSNTMGYDSSYKTYWYTLYTKDVKTLGSSQE